MSSARLPSASPWRRLMCIAYEAVLLFGVLFFFAYAFSALTQFKGDQGPLLWSFQAFILTVSSVYYGWSWSGGRRTLPMKTMMVRLETEPHVPPDAARATLRFLAAGAMTAAALACAAYVHGLFALLVFVPGAWSLVDRDRRALYDIACGTRLVFDRGAREAH
ncbi:MAG: RDD family protein [Burkholderiaceae bacterium]|nr:RDD family protein [Burkholderiaceae bacterium]